MRPGQDAGAQGPGARVGQVDVETRELRRQETGVEGGVVGDEDAVVEKLGELRGDARETRRRHQLRGADAVDVRVVDVTVRLHERLPGGLDGEVFVEKHHADLDDPVRGPEPGGLQIEDSGLEGDGH